MSTTHIRRQVYDLTPADLERFAVWEYALDEEGNEGQDEATVRPYKLGEALDTAEGMFIVRASMTLADGTRFTGYVTPSVQGGADLSSCQPAVVVQDGQVSFWRGMLALHPEDLFASYALLGKTSPDQVFPIKFESDVSIARGPVVGEVPGFLILEDFETMRTRVVT
jgi:hypothetical protein